MTRRSAHHVPERATDREVGVVAAVLAAGSEKAAAHRLGLSHSTVKHHLASARSKVGAATTAQLVWILAPRLPEPEGPANPDDVLAHTGTAGAGRRSAQAGGSAPHGSCRVARRVRASDKSSGRRQ